MTAQEHEPAPAELDRTTAAARITCRYRLLAECAAEWGSDPGRIAHEKVKHAALLVTLRACPECGTNFTDEIRRARHLRDEHGITALSPYRQELDARQVKELYDARQAQNRADLAEFEEVVVPLMRAREAAAEVDALTDPDANLLRDSAPVSLNGHSPATLDLSAAQDSFIAVLAEVEALRAENAVLKAENAVLAQIRGLLASD